jgi:hypothetical protein
MMYSNEITLTFKFINDPIEWTVSMNADVWGVDMSILGYQFLSITHKQCL